MNEVLSRTQIKNGKQDLGRLDPRKSAKSDSSVFPLESFHHDQLSLNTCCTVVEYGEIDARCKSWQSELVCFCRCTYCLRKHFSFTYFEEADTPLQGGIIFQVYIEEISGSKWIRIHYQEPAVRPALIQ